MAEHPKQNGMLGRSEAHLEHLREDPTTLLRRAHVLKLTASSTWQFFIKDAGDAEDGG